MVGGERVENRIERKKKKEALKIINFTSFQRKLSEYD